MYTAARDLATERPANSLTKPSNVQSFTSRKRKTVVAVIATVARLTATVARSRCQWDVTRYSIMSLTSLSSREIAAGASRSIGAAMEVSICQMSR